MTARYHVGIDLGTTNCVVAFGKITGDRRVPPTIEVLPIPQRTGADQIESLPSLPSFVYLPRSGEIDSLRDDWTPDPVGGVVGAYARSQAADNPDRVVVAAKSWLSHGRGRDAVLPIDAPEDITRVSAADCTRRLLSHLVAAWDAAHPNDRLADQNVVLTVPASFDPAARELTRQAAMDAGLPDETVLLEEPTAAVYHWLHRCGDDWRQSLSAGDTLLVVDVGGGTTDLTLIAAEERDGSLAMRRLAVGKHLLLGGDNMDLALAYAAAGKFESAGHRLDPWQSTSLWHACRAAKEQLLSTGGPASRTISVPGRGSSIIAGTISVEITRDEAAELLVDGFFPRCRLSDHPVDQPASGFQDVGLPFESDAAITRHVAAFVDRHRSNGQRDNGSGGDQKQDDAPGLPTRLLLNGGVLRSEVLRRTIVAAIGDWCGDDLQTLGGPDDLDVAVAVGAAFYGHVKHTGGVRIRGGTARSYYIGVETAGMAIPGVPRPLRAVCVAPRGMEEGTQTEVPMPAGRPVGVVVGRPAVFRFFASTDRDDPVGGGVDRPPTDDVYEAQPVTVTLDDPRDSDDAGDSVQTPPAGFVPVRFVSRITELGMFELWCHAAEDDRRWKMEFNVRSD